MNPESQLTTKKKTAKKNHIFAVGRRKTATARAYLYLKPGPVTVNGKPIEEYFPGIRNEVLYRAPFRLTDTENKFSASFKVSGSGVTGQLDAVVHALARALASHDREAYRKPLKEKGLLTRDSRTRERRKVGMGGKARRKKQSPKR